MNDEKREAYRRIHEFNHANPPGSPVLAWPGTRDQKPLRTRTRYSAWLIDSGQPVVRVVGYAGGIHLDHIEPDPTRQPAPPEVEFEPPPCPLCGEDLDSDGDSLFCHHCDVSWDSNGTHGRWGSPDAPRCPATRRLVVGDGDEFEQCALAAEHSSETHRPADGIGSWTDRDDSAVTDAWGEPA